MNRTNDVKEYVDLEKCVFFFETTYKIAHSYRKFSG